MRLMLKPMPTLMPMPTTMKLTMRNLALTRGVLETLPLYLLKLPLTKTRGHYRLNRLGQKSASYPLVSLVCLSKFGFMFNSFQLQNQSRKMTTTQASGHPPYCPSLTLHSLTEVRTPK